MKLNVITGILLMSASTLTSAASARAVPPAAPASEVSGASGTSTSGTSTSGASGASGIDEALLASSMQQIAAARSHVLTANTAPASASAENHALARASAANHASASAANTSASAANHARPAKHSSAAKHASAAKHSSVPASASASAAHSTSMGINESALATSIKLADKLPADTLPANKPPAVNAPANKRGATHGATQPANYSATAGDDGASVAAPPVSALPAAAPLAGKPVAETPAANPAPANPGATKPAPVATPHSADLLLHENQLLSQQLDQWAKSHGLHMLWNSKLDYLIYSPILLRGKQRDDVLNQLGELFQSQNYGLVIRLYEANNVLVIDGQ